MMIRKKRPTSMNVSQKQFQGPVVLIIGILIGSCIAFLIDRTVWFRFTRPQATQGAIKPPPTSRRGTPTGPSVPQPLTLDDIPPISTASEHHHDDKQEKDRINSDEFTEDASADYDNDTLGRALSWLIRHQRADGSWTFDLTQCPSCGGRCGGSGIYADDYGATALSLLAFLGRGYSHKEGPYKQELEKAVAILAKRSMDTSGGKQLGQIYAKPDHGMYVQGFATQALAECYALTQDRRLLDPTQCAVHFIEHAQHGSGGWRYQPRKGEADVVSTGCQVMALKSAYTAYLEINPMRLPSISRFLDKAATDGGARYAYIAGSQQDRDGPTAVALLCRMHLGWKRDEPALQDGATRLARPGPTKDLYYDYHATQIMHHMEGDLRVTWNNRMKDLLLKSQATEGHMKGSWYEGFEDDQSARAGGRLLCTAMAAMILEVSYRHLPLYRNHVVTDEFLEE